MFCKTVNNVSNIKGSRYKLASTRRSIVLSLTLQLEFPAIKFNRTTLRTPLQCENEQAFTETDNGQNSWSTLMSYSAECRLYKCHGTKSMFTIGNILLKKFSFLYFKKFKTQKNAKFNFINWFNFFPIFTNELMMYLKYFR